MQVCGPAPGTACREVESEECSLVPDAVCRNITETRSGLGQCSDDGDDIVVITIYIRDRFDEKCWVEEEEDCRTVYDTVVEHKCEMVNRYTTDKKIFIKLENICR